MGLNHRTLFFFFYSLLFALLMPALIPHLPLMFFAPFLIIACYNQSKTACLWWALSSGLIIDLLSAHTHLGVHALNYCVTIWFLYPQKQHFFEDSVTTFPIMTFLFSVLSTLFLVVILFLLGQGITLSVDWIKYDLFLLPLLDSFYAGLLFTLPYLFLPKSNKRISSSFGRL